MFDHKFLQIIMILIVFQSTVAVADLHQAHQSGQDHLQFEHAEETGHFEKKLMAQVKIESFSTNSDIKTLFDCHHCCHCHGVSSTYLAPNKGSQVHYTLKKSISLHIQHPFSSRIISPETPPPIV